MKRKSGIKEQIGAKLLELDQEDLQGAVELIDAHLKEVGGGRQGFDNLAPPGLDEHNPA